MLASLLQLSSYHARITSGQLYGLKRNIDIGCLFSCLSVRLPVTCSY